jgi:hypothetical protein
MGTSILLLGDLFDRMRDATQSQSKTNHLAVSTLVGLCTGYWITFNSQGRLALDQLEANFSTMYLNMAVDQKIVEQICFYCVGPDYGSPHDGNFENIKNVRRSLKAMCLFAEIFDIYIITWWFITISREAQIIYASSKTYAKKLN